MNGLERITSRIEAEARNEVHTIVEAGRAEISTAVNGWLQRIDTERTELEERNRKAAAEREERLKSAAEMDARKTILGVKQELVEEAYAKALDQLCALSGQEKINLLADLLVRASSSGTEEAVFSETDKADGAKAVEKANAASGKKLTASKDAAPIRGGFILRDKNVEVNCAFETLVRLQKAETAGAVAKILFQ
ncbi:MAG: V-type ATP synthase subunit E [Oscillospiraceae bacterium]|nr:V-type ATP synthase subunit E [Oscillospiraceae bacterium]